MVDDEDIVRAMAANTLADETPLFSAGLKYVLNDITKDFSIWKLRMESDLQGHGLWPLVEGGPTDAKAKRLMMQHLGDEIIREEGSAVGGSALWDTLAAAYKDRMAFKMPYMVDDLETLKLKPGESIESLWSRMKILRADLHELGYECSDQSIVQRIYRNLKLQPAWRAAMYHLAESVLTVKLPKFKIQLQLVEPSLPAVVPAHAAQASPHRPGRGGRNERGRGGGNRKWLSQDEWNAKATCKRCHLVGHVAQDCRAPHPLPKPVQAHAASISNTGWNEGEEVTVEQLTTCHAMLAAYNRQNAGTLDWLADSGAGRHMTNDAHIFTATYALMNPVQVAYGDGHRVPAMWTGTVTLPATSGNVTLHDVLYVPSLLVNLISLSALAKTNHATTIAPLSGDVVFSVNGEPVMTATMKKDLFWIDMRADVHLAAVTSVQTLTAQQWHVITGHTPYGTLARMARNGTIPGCILKPSDFLQAGKDAACELCLRAKQHRQGHPATAAASKLERIEKLAIDVRGTPDEGYTVIAIDLCTQWACGLGVTTKSSDDTLPFMQSVVAMLERQTGMKVKCIICDGGKEFMNNAWDEWLASTGIQRECTSKATPEQNAHVERFNQTVMCRSRANLLQSNLPASYLPYAIDMAIDEYNITPASRNPISPNFSMFGKQPAIIRKAFGSKAWIHVNSAVRGKGHLQDQCEPGILIGYSKPLRRGMYRVLIGGKVKDTCDVTFIQTPHYAPVNAELTDAAPQEPLRECGLQDWEVLEEDWELGGPEPAHDAGELQPAAQPPAQPAPPLEIFEPAAGDDDNHPVEAVQAPQPPGPGDLDAADGGAEPPYAVQQPAANVEMQSSNRPIRLKNPIQRYAGSADVHAIDTIAMQAEASLYLARATKPSTQIQPNTSVRKFQKYRLPSWSTCRGATDRLFAQLDTTRLGMQPTQNVLSKLANLEKIVEGVYDAQEAMSADHNQRSRSEPMCESESRVPCCLSEQSPVAAAFSHSHLQQPEPDPPKNYAAAMLLPDAAEWKRAVLDELKSMEDNNVWELVPLPPGKRAIGSRIVLDRKRADEHGYKRYKARFVAQGFSQVSGVDYDLTYSPVCKLATLRALLATAAHEDLFLRQFDVKTAFLQAELEEEVYMTQPKGFERGEPGWVCRLMRAIYGLKQAGRAWFLKFKRELLNSGFRQCYSDPSMFTLTDELGNVLCLLYVDDGIIAGASQTAVDAAFAIISKAFEVRDMGEPTNFLGIQISRDRLARTLTIHQSDYCTELVSRYHLPTHPALTPMDSRLKLTSEGPVMLNPERYPALIGELQHLVNCTRPEIAKPVSALGSFNNRPTEQHWEAALRVLSYISGTLTMGITYGASDVPLEGFTDSDFAIMPKCRSTTGMIFSMYGGPVSWQSKLQPTPAGSTSEAEYQAANAGGKEALWLRKVLRDLGRPALGPVIVQCDNTCAIALMMNNDMITQRAKHIDVIHHWCLDRIGRKELAFKYCSTGVNRADGLTKALPRPAFLAALRMWSMALFKPT